MASRALRNFPDTLAGWLSPEGSRGARVQVPVRAVAANSATAPGTLFLSLRAVRDVTQVTQTLLWRLPEGVSLH